MDVTVNFILGTNITIVQCSSNDKMSEIFRKFITNLNIQANINDFEYIYNAKELSGESTLANNIKIGSDKIISIIVKRRVRICKCPECICNDCIINLLNYQAAFYGCKYDTNEDENLRHKRVTLYDNYANNQNIDYSQIKCHTSGCPNTLANYYNNFYKCLFCSQKSERSKYFCNDCITSHRDLGHEYVKYDEKNYYCQNHCKIFENYCFDCKKDLCKECKGKHLQHKTVDYSEMTTNIEDLKNVLGKIRNSINALSLTIDNIKDILDGTKRIYERYYNIVDDIIKKYELFNKDLKNYNYKILRTIRNLKISNTQIIEDLKKIIDEGDTEKQSSFIMSTYNNIMSIYSNKSDQVKGTEKKQHNNKIEKEMDDKWYEEICQIREEKKKNDITKNKGVLPFKHKNQ